MTIVRKCGACHFGKFLPQDLTKRLCFGAPPSVVGVMNGRTVQMARPIVGVGDDACAAFRSKDAAEMQLESEQVAAVERAEPIRTQ